MVCDVTQHFRSFGRQIDAIHYNLITFAVLRCLECFATYLDIIDGFDVKSVQIHRYVITFDIKSMQVIVFWSLL